ncbi:MAG: hypothetical protein KJN84_03100, partial [Bacteroidia bacterium]|nr:hypothetical protein [Bacteroidia bacterium]
QKLSKVLSETLEKELNKVFTNLDTKTPGEKFSKGVTDNLLSKEVEKKITDMLSDIINTADSGVGIAIGNLDKNINESVSRIFRNLDANLSSLDKQIVQVFSKTLRDSLTGFINGFVEDVDLKALSSKISTDLLSVELRDTLLSIAREVKKEVPLKEDVTDIIGVIKENATSIILLLGAIIAGLMFLRARLKKKREEDLDIASVVHKAMNDDEAFKNKLEKMLADKNRLEDFKKRIDKYKDS